MSWLLTDKEIDKAYLEVSLGADPLDGDLSRHHDRGTAKAQLRKVVERLGEGRLTSFGIITLALTKDDWQNLRREAGL